jgi:hypothetical protein
MAEHAGMSTTASMTIRPARPVDEWAVTRLAQLDESRPLTGDVLLAEADGRPIAAVEVSSGAAVADPFVPSAGAVAVLKMRAAQLRAPAAPRRPLLRRAHLRAASG